MSRIEARLCAEPLHADAELARFGAASAGAGGIVTFSGIMRPAGAAGEALTGLFLDHYPGMTEASIEAIVGAAAERHDLIAALAVHRCGLVLPGETIVFVAAAARHRREAFLAADEMMDRLKTEAMFWKQERSLDGARWIEPSDRDRSDLERWR